jgi:phospholipase/carboxylesterase
MTEDLGFIHRFVPADDAATGDTLVVLHGTGGDENDLVGVGQAIAPGAAILSPRGNVLENGAPRFFKRLSEGVFDPREVRTRAEELARFVRAAAVTYRLDSSRIFALGYSNGANVASTVMLVEPGIFQAAVLLRPMVVYEPTERSDLSRTAALISSGRMDPIVPTESVERLVHLLESEGAEVTLKWQLTGHNLLPSEIREAADWLALRRTRV